MYQRKNKNKSFFSCNYLFFKLPYIHMKEKLLIATLIIVSALVFIGQYKRLKLETEANQAIIENLQK